MNTDLSCSVSNGGFCKLFENDLFKVRVVIRDGEPWFVARDVAVNIDHSDCSAMCKLCRAKDKVVVRAKDLMSDALSDVRNREYTLISESGLYRVLAKCNLPKCDQFESFVFDDALPKMRKEALKAKTDSYLIDDPIKRAERWIEEQKEKQRLEAERDEAIKKRIAINDKRTATLMVAKREDNKKIKSLTSENTELKEQNEILKVSLGESTQWMSSAQLIQNFNLKRVDGKLINPRTLTTLLKKCGCKHRKSDFPDKSGFNYTIFFVEDVKKALNIF